MMDLQACRVCLITGVKMYDLRAHPYEQIYESIIGFSVEHASSLPVVLCYECCNMMVKVANFQRKCLRGHSTLLNLLNQFGQLTEAEIKNVDREKSYLSSSLVKHTPCEDTIECVSHEELVEVKVKEEHITIEETTNQIELDADVDTEVKHEFEENYAMDDIPSGESSDDNTPLALSRGLKEDKKHRKKEKIKKEKKFKIKTPEYTTEIEEENSLLVEDVKVNKKAKKKRKLEESFDDFPGKIEEDKIKEKKKRRTKANASNGCIDDVDLEDYVTIIKLSIDEQHDEILKRKESANYKNAPFKCTMCFKGFVDTEAFKNHMVKHDLSAGEIECPICKFRFPNKRALQKHASNHEKKYACKSCSYVSKTTTQAKQHQKWHKGVTYKCQYCDEISTKWTSYLSHVRIKHPSQFICAVCGYSFVSKLGLAMHKTMMHKDSAVEGLKEGGRVETKSEGLYCKECDVEFANEEAYKRHMVTSALHTINNQFGNGCRVCGETFGSGEELRVHHRKQHARKRPKNYGKKPSDLEWPIKCEHCGEEIESAREYWTHFRRVHPDKKYPVNKSFMCEICGKGFRGNAFLVYHKRTHSDERMYKCEQCPKSFFNRTNLQMHEKTHSDNRPYPCSVCYKAFKLKGALDRHFRSHTGVKPYECEYCGKAFGQSNSRKLHVRTVHLKQPAPYISRSRLERRRAIDQAKAHPPSLSHLPY